MAYWLLKSEPSCFSLDDLMCLPDQVTAWDGVRNYQARNYLRAMQKNDLAFFYHSSCLIPAIVGVVCIIKEAYPEKDPLWSAVDVRFVEKFSRPLSLSALKKASLAGLEKIPLLQKGSRLSVMPVKPFEWAAIQTLLSQKAPL